MDIAEFILKMFTMGFLIAGILGMILQSGAFQGQVRVYDNIRMTVDLAHAIAAAPCLAETVYGEVRKGVIDAAKVQSAKANFCVNAPIEFYAKISERGGQEVISIGKDFSGGTTLSRALQVLIKYSDRTAAGILNVKVK